MIYVNTYLEADDEEQAVELARFRMELGGWTPGDVASVEESHEYNPHDPPGGRWWNVLLEAPRATIADFFLR